MQSPPTSPPTWEPRAAFFTADRAIQTFGGLGYAKSTDIERHWRDSRLFRTGPVPEEMVLNFLGQRVLQLAEELLKMDFTYDKSIVEKVRAVSSRFDEKYWREVYRKQEFPHEYWNGVAEADLFGLVIPQRYGGMEKTLVDLAIGTAETAERYSGIASYLVP